MAVQQLHPASCNYDWGSGLQRKVTRPDLAAKAQRAVSRAVWREGASRTDSGLIWVARTSRLGFSEKFLRKDVDLCRRIWLGIVTPGGHLFVTGLTLMFERGWKVTCASDRFRG
jgi:hypothetical protein